MSSFDGYDILLTGDYFSDLIFTGLPEIPRLGHEVYAAAFDLLPGGVVTHAVALKRLGMRAAWPCVFGNDLFSQHILQEVRREGLEERFFQMDNRPRHMLTVAFSFAHERAFLSYAQSAARADEAQPFHYVDLIEQLRPRCLMLTHLWRGEALREVVRAARTVGAQVFLECQANPDPGSLDDPEIIEALRLVDIFAPNAAEAMQVSGEDSPQKALDRLGEYTPLVVIKLGVDGAIARRGAETARAGGQAVECVDTTGAGDNFDCGFLYGLLKGYSLEDCLNCGNICGGLSVTTRGGATSSPTAQVVEEWRARLAAGMG